MTNEDYTKERMPNLIRYALVGAVGALSIGFAIAGAREQPSREIDNQDGTVTRTSPRTGENSYLIESSDMYNARGETQ
jgi:hypothetical protein|tara:strand:- start:21 stop:254 length:234 start_codon:yes stop_codon:yes gene_type:complete